MPPWSQIVHVYRIFLVTFNPVKTEVLYYGNGQPPNLDFDSTMLTPSESHTHLGVTLSNNCKWTIHINNIILSATKLLGIIRKIKYTIRGRAFNQIYISFIRPRLEYASSVWYNCNQLEQNMIIVDAVHHYINATKRFENNYSPTIAHCNYILISHSLFLFSVHLLILHFFLKNILYMLYCHVDLIIYYVYKVRAVTKFTNL